MVTVDDPVGFNDPDGRDPTYYATGVAYGPTGLPESIDPVIGQLFGLSGNLLGTGLDSGTGELLAAWYFGLLGSGGNVPSNKGGLNTNPTTAASTAWLYLNSVWADCLTDFKSDPNFDAKKFKNLLNGGITWLDESDPSVAARTINSYVGNGDNSSISSRFMGNTSASALLGFTFVALGPDYFTDETQTQKIADTIHEGSSFDFTLIDWRYRHKSGFVANKLWVHSHHALQQRRDN